MATFMVRADVASVDQVEAAVAAKQAELKDSMPDADEDERRVRAVHLMTPADTFPFASRLSRKKQVDQRSSTPTVVRVVWGTTGR
jgi:hypothetical protein